MSKFDYTKYIVRVIAENRNGKKQIATGALVRKGVIVTVKHVFEFDDDEKLKNVYIQQITGADGQDMSLQYPPIKVGYESVIESKNLDIAFVICRELESSIQNVGIETSEILAGRACEVKGFSKAKSANIVQDKKSTTARLLQTMGKTHSCNGESHCQIKASNTSISTDDWKGVSGAPVISGANNLGLLVTHSEAFSGELHFLTYCEVLKKDVSFFQELFPIDIDAICEQADSKISNQLQKFVENELSAEFKTLLFGAFSVDEKELATYFSSNNIESTLRTLLHTLTGANQYQTIPKHSLLEDYKKLRNNISWILLAGIAQNSMADIVFQCGQINPQLNSIHCPIFGTIVTSYAAISEQTNPPSPLLDNGQLKFFVASRKITPLLFDSETKAAEDTFIKTLLSDLGFENTNQEKDSKQSVKRAVRTLLGPKDNYETDRAQLVYFLTAKYYKDIYLEQWFNDIAIALHPRVKFIGLKEDSGEKSVSYQLAISDLCTELLKIEQSLRPSEG